MSVWSLPESRKKYLGLIKASMIHIVANLIPAELK